MIDQIAYILRNFGFNQIDTNIPELYLFFQMEKSFINAIYVIDVDADKDLTKEKVSQLTGPIHWQLADGKQMEIHEIKLLLGSDVEKMQAFGDDDYKMWYIDAASRILLVPSDKLPDFYGLKGYLETELQKEPMEILPVEEEIIQQATKPDKNTPPPLVTYFLIMLNAIVFMVCIFTGELLYKYGIMNAEGVVTNGQWYRLISAMFLHADIEHLLNNMLLLFVIGEMVESHMGRRFYLLLYIGSGIIGGLTSLEFEYIKQSFVGSIGASGAVFGVVGALLWIIICNKGRVETITTKKLLFMIILSLFAGFRSTGIDNAAHVGGLIAGFLLAILLYRKKETTEKNETLS